MLSHNYIGTEHILLGLIHEREGVAARTLESMNVSLEAVSTRYYDRTALKAGNRLKGPAILNQYDSTTVIPPGIEAYVDRFGNIVIEVGGSAEARAIAAASAVTAP